jgi:2'-5' RNA ligase
MRLFFAYHLPDELRKHYREFRERFDPQLPLRWLQDEHWHVTTIFLGSECSLDKALEIGNILCPSLGPIHLEQYSFKKFPRKKPNMIWADYWKTEAFTQVCSSFHEAFKLDLPYEPYPHSTLCRAKRSDLISLGMPDFPLWPDPIELNRIDLWNSRPGDKERRFEILKSWDLKRRSYS